MACSSLFMAAALLGFLGCGLSKGGLYSGYKVLRVAATHDGDLLTLIRILANQTQVDVWRYPSPLHPFLDIQLSPNDYDSFTALLGMLNSRHFVLIEDLQALIDQEWEQQQRPSGSNGFDYGKYYPFDEIRNWMEAMIDNYKANATKFHVGFSRMNNPIEGIKISTPSDGKKKPALWIQGGVHGREWISPATILYMTHRMLRGLKHDTKISKMVEMYDWYILPIVNPDSYTYTWEKDRMWSKTRWCKSHFVPWPPYKETKCYGTDPNRNWDSHWCVVGGSQKSNSPNYCGESPFSEPSVKALAEFLRTIRLEVFLDLHSYGQMWLTPWGYTEEASDDFKEQLGGAKAASKAIAESGTVYAFGSMAHVEGLQSGTGLDWVYGVLGVKYSYQVELGDTGKHGFLVPADEIIRSGKETLDGILALVQHIKNATIKKVKREWEYI